MKDDLEKRPRIRSAQSCAIDAREASREFHAAVAQPDMALVIFFCSSEYDLEVLAEEMKRLFAGVQVVGCTTAGEIGLAGYQDHSLTGASFPADSFSAVSGRLDHLQQFEISKGQAFTQELLQRLESHAPQTNTDNSFALLLSMACRRPHEAVRARQRCLLPLRRRGVSAGSAANDTGQRGRTGRAVAQCTGRRPGILRRIADRGDRTGDELIAAADSALYAAKEGGRNRVQVNAGPIKQ